LKKDSEFRLLCKKNIEGNKDFMCVDYTNLYKKLKIGDHIVVNYGKAYLKVIDFEEEDQFI
jgi:pyruvate kinase